MVRSTVDSGLSSIGRTESVRSHVDSGVSSIEHTGSVRSTVDSGLSSIGRTEIVRSKADSAYARMRCAAAELSPSSLARERYLPPTAAM